MTDNTLKEDFLISKDLKEEDNKSIYSNWKSKYLTSDNIGRLLACCATFCTAFGSFYTKVIQRTYPDKFHTVPFLFMRSFTILILATLRAKLHNEAILRPNEITNKKWFFIRTNINFFGVSSITMALWYLRASTAQIISSLNPILVFVLSYFILKEEFYYRYLIGILMCISGSLIIVLNEKDAKDDIHDTNPKDKSHIETLIGVGFALFSACAVALVSFSNKILVDFKVSINSQMFYVGISTMTYSFIFVCFFGGVEWDIGYLVMCSIHGIFFFITNIAYNMALTYCSLSKIALINYLQIVFVFILAFLFLHESIFITDLLGAAIIMSYLCYDVYYPLPKTKR